MSKTDTKDADANEQTSQRVPLGTLRPNSYNPRENLTNIDSLAESIKQDGLLQSLAVRPINGDDEFEVIAGMRRLAALEQLYDDDHLVSVEVRDVDDDTAFRLSLKENLERENLNTMEEARAFARVVKVQWCNDCGERVRNGHGGSNGHDVVNKSVMDLITQGRIVDLKLPSRKHPSVKSVAADYEDLSASYISDHLTFVTLPDDAQEMIKQGELTARAARMLARINIDDEEERKRAIMGIIDDLPDAMKDTDYDDLKKSIEQEEQDYRERKKLAQEAVEEYSNLVDQRREKLHDAIDDAGDQLEEDPEKPDDIDELAETADELADRLEQEAGDIRSEVNDLADEQDALDVQIERTTKAIMNYDHDDEACGYCGSDVAQDALRERKESLQEDREVLGDKRSTLSSRASDHEDVRQSLKRLRRGILNARDEYQNAIDQAEEANAN